MSPSGGEIPVGNRVDVECNKYIRETRKSSENDGDTTIIVVRQRSAKPSFTSSNLVVTSKISAEYSVKSLVLRIFCLFPGFLGSGLGAKK